MTLTFNGKNIADFSAFWDGSKLFDSPEKDVEFISVLGRNGDLSISNGRYKNIEITVPVFIRNDFKPNFNALVNFLLAQDGYQKLETSEEPGIYRMAQFISAVQPRTGSFNISGSASLVFTCKPQKYLKVGDKGTSYANGASNVVVENPTLMTALPLIEVTGTGTITINSSELTLSTNTGTTYIDCEIEDAYEGVINRNGDLSVTGGFPKLLAGTNYISVSGCDIVLHPRWWVL